MIESWIDDLAAVWAFQVNTMQRVRSFKLIGHAEFPASIDPAQDFPLALTIPSGVMPEYSVGGPRFGIWNGITEFHVAPSVDKSLMPSLIKWYGLIWAAAAGNMKLNNKVELFMIPSQEDAISGPLALQYGNEAEHWGFIVRWSVKEHVTLTVSA